MTSTKRCGGSAESLQGEIILQRNRKTNGEIDTGARESFFVISGGCHLWMVPKVEQHKGLTGQSQN